MDILAKSDRLVGRPADAPMGAGTELIESECQEDDEQDRQGQEQSPEAPVRSCREDLRHTSPIAVSSRFPTKTLRRRSARSEAHTSELQSLMRISYAVICLKNNKD